jgi:hypothetical protein
MQKRNRFLTLAAAAVLALSTLPSLAAPAFAAGGQTGVIRGTVVDGSNAALTGADVMLNGPLGRYTAHTDTHGRFALVGVLADTYTLTVRKDGTVRVNQPGIGVVGDNTVDLGTIIAPSPPSAGS